MLCASYLFREFTLVPRPCPLSSLSISRLHPCCPHRYLVAPYEADAQLALLARLGLVWAVYSSDGDMLVYQVPRVIRRYDQQTGIAQMYTLESIKTGPASCHGKHTSTCSCTDLMRLYQKWGPIALVWYAIIAGCDYVKFEGFGAGLAITVMKKLKKLKGGAVPTSANLLAAMRAVRPTWLPPDGAAESIQSCIDVYFHQEVRMPCRCHAVPHEMREVATTSHLCAIRPGLSPRYAGHAVTECSSSSW